MFDFRRYEDTFDVFIEVVDFVKYGVRKIIVRQDMRIRKIGFR